jgi:hypothetical protein
MVTCDPGERGCAWSLAAKTLLDRARPQLAGEDRLHRGAEVDDAWTGAANGFSRFGLQRGLRIASSAQRRRRR